MRGRVLAVDAIGQDVEAVKRPELALQPDAELRAAPVGVALEGADHLHAPRSRRLAGRRRLDLVLEGEPTGT